MTDFHSILDKFDQHRTKNDNLLREIDSLQLDFYQYLKDAQSNWRESEKEYKDIKATVVLVNRDRETMLNDIHNLDYKLARNTEAIDRLRGRCETSESLLLSCAEKMDQKLQERKNLSKIVQNEQDALRLLEGTMRMQVKSSGDFYQLHIDAQCSNESGFVVTFKKKKNHLFEVTATEPPLKLPNRQFRLSQLPELLRRLRIQAFPSSASSTIPE